ncbi:uncharacterized protein A1O5_01064 [Cladophialophora psammophila CBS 110553]|uniref:Uncharacterized protein n=1 Tax=Cladophialophora psammophila CBS 110553 TaxID=1182543 RepID=W9XHY0_9EURO|nr:uncharacterized protein A1O5_01064 [Cladophialophora psammophila CBS 110553]EXJ76556.1 hypothetical protein A1O5_01064 [Cladophialophora psammophila CBS 110553]
MPSVQNSRAQSHLDSYFNPRVSPKHAVAFRKDFGGHSYPLISSPPTSTSWPTKATIKGMELMGGGHGTVSTVKWLGRTIAGLDAMAAAKVEAGSTRGKMVKISGNTILLKASQPTDGGKVTFKVLDTQAKGMKSQKTWSKKRGREASCDAVVLVDGGGAVDVLLEMVARIQRVCSIWEGREMQKRFGDQWRLPVLR